MVAGKSNDSMTPTDDLRRNSEERIAKGAQDRFVIARYTDCEIADMLALSGWFPTRKTLVRGICIIMHSAEHSAEHNTGAAMQIRCVKVLVAYLRFLVRTHRGMPALPMSRLAM